MVGRQVQQVDDLVLLRPGPVWDLAAHFGQREAEDGSYNVDPCCTRRRMMWTGVALHIIRVECGSTQDGCWRGK